MAQIVMHCEMGKDTYDVADRFLRGMPGGLGMTSTVFGAIFGAVCGASTAGTATVGWSDSVARRTSPATYVVEFGPDLLSRTNWIPLPGSVSGGQWQGVLPPNAQRGFIRIRRAP